MALLRGLTFFKHTNEDDVFEADFSLPLEGVRGRGVAEESHQARRVRRVLAFKAKYWDRREFNSQMSHSDFGGIFLSPSIRLSVNKKVQNKKNQNLNGSGFLV